MICSKCREEIINCECREYDLVDSLMVVMGGAKSDEIPLTKTVEKGDTYSVTNSNES